MIKKILIGIVAVAAIGAGVYYFLPKTEKTEKVEWVTTTITNGNIVQSITATGTIEPVTQVDIGTQVSGILTNLYVDYNSIVKKGQIIAELDKSTLLLDRNSNKNSVATAQSKLKYEEANFKRIEGLFKKGLIADTEYEVALYDYESAKNSLEIAKNTLQRSEINLGYATIYSPIDGVVLSRSVEEGQTVASSFSTPTLFTVAADLKDMRVIVDVDEADIGNVTEGQKATFTVDAFPLDTFEGIVTQVRKEAIIESNVVTYEVVISAANPDLKLKPGLTANVEVFTLDVECEKLVSAAALAFTPSTGEEASSNSAAGNMGPSQGGRPEGGRPEGGRPEGGRPEGGRPEGMRAMGDAAGAENVGVLWVLDGDKIYPRRIATGVTNGILTEVNGNIEAGTVVVTGMVANNTGKVGRKSNEKNPFVQQRPGGKR